IIDVRPARSRAAVITATSRVREGFLMEETVYVSGSFRPAADATVSVFDHGLLYGDGIFEGIRAYNGRVFKLERHIDRLFDSAKAIRLQIPHSHAELCAIVVESCRRNGITDGYIRLVVTRGAGDLGLDPRNCSRAELIVIVKASLSIYRSPASGIRRSEERRVGKEWRGR